MFLVSSSAVVHEMQKCTNRMQGFFAPKPVADLHVGQCCHPDDPDRWAVGGMAACAQLQLVAVSFVTTNKIGLFRLPRNLTGPNACFEYVGTLGGATDRLGLAFGFGAVRTVPYPPCASMAFAGSPASPFGRVLLVGDPGFLAVHVVDVLRKEHVGYVVPPGSSFCFPQGVAARDDMAAVSSWVTFHQGVHRVCLFQGSGPCWTLVRVLGAGLDAPEGHFSRPRGLRFSSDGKMVVVADTGSMSVKTYTVHDGAYVRRAQLDGDKNGSPMDVEEFGPGWLVASIPIRRSSTCLHYIVSGGKDDVQDVQDEVLVPMDTSARFPTSVAWCPGLGLLVMESRSRVSLFAPADELAKARMSSARVAWMYGVARGVSFRSHAPCGPCGGPFGPSLPRKKRT